jgi:hypothetical protein
MLAERRLKFPAKTHELQQIMSSSIGDGLARQDSCGRVTDLGSCLLLHAE